MSKGKRNRAIREAQKIAHAHTQWNEGTWVGAADREHPVAARLIELYGEWPTKKACPHLHDDFDQPRFWVQAVPEILSCLHCTPAIAREEQRRKTSCCIFCGQHTLLRGVTATVGPVVMRGGVCEECESSSGIA